MMISIGTIIAAIELRDDFTPKLQLITQQMTAAAGRAKSLGEGLQNAGSKLLPVSAGVGAAGLAIAKAAIDFESSFAGVRKTVDATEGEFQMLAKGMRNMAKEIPVSVNELNRIGEAAGQLGIRTENILGFTRVMADLGVTTNLSADQAATSLARLANITQMPQDQFDRLGSTIVGLGNNFATTESEIVDFGLRIAGAGAQAKMSEADILAIGTALSSVGVEAEAGGTAVQKVILEMVKATVQGGDALETFAATAGLSASEFKAAFEKDAAGAFTLFVEGLAREGQNAINVLADLGLEDQRLIRSFLALSGAGDTLRRAIGLGNEEWRKNTALTKEAEERYRTAASQLKTLWGQVVDVAITLGSSLLPVINSGVQAFREWLPLIERSAQWFASLDPAVHKAVFALGALVAAGGPAIYMLGQLLLAIGAFRPALAWFVGAQGVAGAAQGLNTTATAARSAGTAFQGATPLVKGFSAALLGIAVPLALEQVVRLIQELRGLVQDGQQWRLDAIAENETHVRMLAEASRVAGREIRNLEEGHRILRAESERLQVTNGGMQQGLEQLRNGTIQVATSLDQVKVSTEGARVTITGLSADAKGSAEGLGAMSTAAKELDAAYRALMSEMRNAEGLAQMDAAAAALERQKQNAEGLYLMQVDAWNLEQERAAAKRQQEAATMAALEKEIAQQQAWADAINSGKSAVEAAGLAAEAAGARTAAGMTAAGAAAVDAGARAAAGIAQARDATLSWSQAIEAAAKGLGTLSGTVQMGTTLDTPEARARIQEFADRGRYYGPVDEFGNPDFKKILKQAVEPRAMGGPVDRGMPYLVGERGPEIFVPPTAGRIVPHGGSGPQLMGGGGPMKKVDVDVTLQIDTRVLAEQLVRLVV